MKALKLIFGESYKTSIVGYIVSGLVAYDGLLKSGETDWKKIIVAVALAVFGRIAGDSSKK